MLKLSEVFSVANLLFLLRGAGLSLGIAVATITIGLLLGTAIAAVRVGNNRFLKLPAVVYVEVVRGTPMLLQISVFYLALPYLYKAVTGHYLPVDPLIMGIIAIGLNSAAYLSEVIRAAVNSIDIGQWEAGQSIGLNQKQLLKKIILPQAYKRVIPPLVNEFITLIKDSSLVSTIGVVELMKAAGILTSRYYDLFSPLIGAAAMYLVMTVFISYLANDLEKRLNND